METNESAIREAMKHARCPIGPYCYGMDGCDKLCPGHPANQPKDYAPDPAMEQERKDEADMDGFVTGILMALGAVVALAALYLAVQVYPLVVAGL